MSKKIFKISLTVLFIFFVVASIDIRIYGKTQSENYLLSSMSDDECYSFVVNNGVNIPESMDEVTTTKKLIKNIILTVEKNPNCTFNYNFIDTAIFAEDVKKLVVKYYDLDNSSSIVGRSLENYYELQDSYVYGGGEWRTFCGDYKTKWYNYNCYAYAIGRTESPANYGEYHNQYQPGVFSDNGSFSYSMDICELAQLVCDDLYSLGMININVYNNMPNILNEDYKMICVRRGPTDYHFMKYDIQTDSWYHKPGKTAVLKYKYSPENNYTWSDEHSLYGVEYAPENYYASEIQYITYQMPKVELNYNTSNLNIEKGIQPGNDIIFEVVVNFEKEYIIKLYSDYIVNAYLYDYDMDLICSITPILENNNVYSIMEDNLSVGVYYLRLDYEENDASGDITITVFSETVNLLYLGNNFEIDENNVFINNHSTGLYKISVNANCLFYDGEIIIFDCQEKYNPMSRLYTSLFVLGANNSYGSNNLVVYLVEGNSYFIDISSRIANGFSATINIELIDNEFEVDLGVSSNYIIMNEEHRLGDHFQKIDLVDNGTIVVEYEYEGIQDETIYFVLFREIFDETTNQLMIELVFPEMMVTYGESLIWESYLYDGVYYIGYFEKLNYNSHISITIITNV